MLKGEKKYNQIVENITTDGNDISKRVLNSEQGEACVFFIKQLTDRTMLSDYIIKPLMEYSKGKSKLSVKELSNHIICCDDCKIETDESKITENILNGMTVILFSWDKEFLIANIKKVEKKQIESPELTYTLRGPRDSFTENLDVNLSLIRYRIKDPELKIQMLEAGKRTKARISVVYINDIANNKIVGDIIQRINNINIDGIIESGEVQSSILNNKFNLFPQMGLVESSDMACGALLEGKVIIITEGSGLALIAPKIFSEFFSTGDDFYDNKYFAFFMKILRIISLFFSFTLGSLYIAVVSFHTDILPADYILSLAILRARVPFNAFTGVLILEIFVEILREGLLRIPKQIGSAIGIVGAIVIGQAAIASGIFSPVLLILISLSLLASFVAPDYTIMNPFRILKFFLMIATSVLGIFGFTFGLCFILINIISTNSFGIAYLAPYSPFNYVDFIKSFFYSKSLSSQRANFLKTKDNKRK